MHGCQFNIKHAWITTLLKEKSFWATDFRTHMTEGKDWFPQVILWPTHIHTHSPTQSWNKYNVSSSLSWIRTAVKIIFSVQSKPSSHFGSHHLPFLIMWNTVGFGITDLDSYPNSATDWIMLFDLKPPVYITWVSLLSLFIVNCNLT